MNLFKSLKWNSFVPLTISCWQITSELTLVSKMTIAKIDIRHQLVVQLYTYIMHIYIMYFSKSIYTLYIMYISYVYTVHNIFFKTDFLSSIHYLNVMSLITVVIVCIFLCCVFTESLVQTPTSPPSLWSHLHHNLHLTAWRGRRCAEQVTHQLHVPCPK